MKWGERHRSFIIIVRGLLFKTGFHSFFFFVLVNILCPKCIWSKDKRTERTMISTLFFPGVTFSRDTTWCSTVWSACMGTRPLWAEESTMCLLMANTHKFKAYTEGLQHSMQCLIHQMHVLETHNLLFLQDGCQCSWYLSYTCRSIALEKKVTIILEIDIKKGKNVLS